VKPLLILGLGCGWPLLGVAPTNGPAAASPAPVSAASTLKPDPFSDPLIRTIQARHEKAVAGDREETKALTADLEKLVAARPDNHLLEAYLGSAYTLSSRDAWIGPGKLTLLRKGGAALDGAVKAEPENPAVRFIRAIDYFELPAIFGKHGVAHADLEEIFLQLQGTLPCDYALEDPTRQAMYDFVGRSRLQFDDKPGARAAWTRGRAIDPSSRLGENMGAELLKAK
jgi:hypothetical protein